MPATSTSFKKGAKPGPGRPKGSRNQKTIEIEMLAREHSEEAMQTLVTIMCDPEEPGKTRVAAANSVLDRGYGKPKQAQEHSGSVEVRHTSAAEEILRRLDAIAGRKEE